MRAWWGADTRLIDAGQGTVLPGFNDAHVHFLAGGFSLSNVNLRDASSVADMALRLADFASRVSRGGWILGGDWDHESWSDRDTATGLRHFQHAG
jgi:predicted amidohydrolase YtcJ